MFNFHLTLLIWNFQLDTLLFTTKLYSKTFVDTTLESLFGEIVQFSVKVTVVGAENGTCHRTDGRKTSSPPEVVQGKDALWPTGGEDEDTSGGPVLAPLEHATR